VAGEKILDLAGDNRFRLADFAVLCPTVQLCDAVSRRFAQMGISCVTKADEAFDLLEERAKVLGYPFCKRVGVPCGFHPRLAWRDLPQPQRSMDDEEAELALERDRTLLYVGMTRAAEALYLVTSADKPSPFLSEVNRPLREEPIAGGNERWMIC
jgi:ATP-dependent exoDNAse (exonuclease V) beta subunit